MVLCKSPGNCELLWWCLTGPRIVAAHSFMVFVADTDFTQGRCPLFIWFITSLYWAGQKSGLISLKSLPNLGRNLSKFKCWANLPVWEVILWKSNLLESWMYKELWELWKLWECVIQTGLVVVAKRKEWQGSELRSPLSSEHQLINHNQGST